MNGHKCKKAINTSKLVLWLNDSCAISYKLPQLQLQPPNQNELLHQHKVISYRKPYSLIQHALSDFLIPKLGHERHDKSNINHTANTTAGCISSKPYFCTKSHTSTIVTSRYSGAGTN